VERLRCVERLEALKARHPFLKPILAYFLGSPGLGTSYPHMSSYLRMEGLESFTVRAWVLLPWSIMNMPFMLTPGASKDRFSLIIVHFTPSDNVGRNGKQDNSNIFRQAPGK